MFGFIHVRGQRSETNLKNPVERLPRPRALRGPCRRLVVVTVVVVVVVVVMTVLLLFGVLT